MLDLSVDVGRRPELERDLGRLGDDGPNGQVGDQLVQELAL